MTVFNLIGSCYGWVVQQQHMSMKMIFNDIISIIIQSINGINCMGLLYMYNFFLISKYLESAYVET